MNATQALIIEHPVADYATWKAAFDAHTDARKDATILAHHLNRGADDTRQIAVFMPFSDRAKVDAFLGSSDLAEKMKAAGVQAKPTITFCSPTRDRVIWDRPLPAFIARHRVADYDAWKKVYDSMDDVRAQAGIVGDAVNRAGDDGNLVIVYHQAESREALEQFLASDTLKKAMADAGVLERPEVTFFDGGLDAAQYA